MARRKKPRSEGSASAVDHASDSEEAAELTRKTRGGKGAKAGKAALKTAASKAPVPSPQDRKAEELATKNDKEPAAKPHPVTQMTSASSKSTGLAAPAPGNTPLAAPQFPRIVAALRAKELKDEEIDEITNALATLGYTAEKRLQDALGVYSAAGFADRLEEKLRWTSARATTVVAAIVQTTQPPAEPERRLSPGDAEIKPQLPLEWVHEHFGNETRDTIDYFVPTREFPRQGRIRQANKVWRNIFSQKDSGRKDLLAIYGTGGAGKTALLRYVCERNSGDVPEDIREWVEQVTVLAVTFNSSTGITSFDHRMIQEEKYLVPVVARLLFAQQSSETSFASFSDALETAYRNQLIDQRLLNNLPSTFSALGYWSGQTGGQDEHVVLFVDELLKIGEGFPSEAEREAAVNAVRHALCGEMDPKPFQVVFSSLSAKAVNAEKTSPTDRNIVRVGLPLLTFGQAKEMLKSNIVAEFKRRNIAEDPDKIHDFFARLSGGHPRTIEYICEVVQQLEGRLPADRVIRRVTKTLVRRYLEPLSEFPWELLLAVLAGDEVSVKTKVSPSLDPNLDFDACVKYGYLINADESDSDDNADDDSDNRSRNDFGDSAGDDLLTPESEVDGAKTFQPRVSELQLLALLKVFEGPKSNDSDATRILDNLRIMLNTADYFTGERFERFHMHWEVVYRNSILLQRREKHPVTLRAFYRCQHATGTLPEQRFKFSELLDLRQFVKLEGEPWADNDRTKLKEFPPSHAEVMNNREWLLYVWFPESERYPAIDFVIFVELEDGKIIALVFQSKYSEAGATTEVGNSAAAAMCANASKIMAAAGWQPEQFVYVIHAYRDTTANLLKAPPAENIMVLTRESLLQLYGSFGRTLEYAWLRTELTVAPPPQSLDEAKASSNTSQVNEL